MKRRREDFREQRRRAYWQNAIERLTEGIQANDTTILLFSDAAEAEAPPLMPVPSKNASQVPVRHVLGLAQVKDGVRSNDFDSSDQPRLSHPLTPLPHPSGGRSH